MANDDYVQHMPAVRAFLSSKLGDGAERDDIEAEVAEAARRLSQNVSHPSKLRSFLVGVAANLVLRHRRAQSREHQQLDQYALEATSQAEDAETILARKQEITEVLEGISALPKAQRDALLLTAVEGLTAREGADHEGVPEATFRTRVFWARKNLEAALGRAAPSKRTRAAAVLVIVMVSSMVVFGAVAVIASRIAAARRSEATPVAPSKVEPKPVLFPIVAGPFFPGATPRAVPTPTSASTPVQQAMVRAPAMKLDLAAYAHALELQVAKRDHEAAEAWSAFMKTAPEGEYRREARFRRALAWARSGQWRLARPELEALSTSSDVGLAREARELLMEVPEGSLNE